MKKPKVWDIAVLTGIVLLIIMFVMVRNRDSSARAVCIILAVYYTCAVFMLIYAFFRQLRYNMYSYNTIYYMGFALFVLFVAASDISLLPLIEKDPGTYGMLTILYNMLGTSKAFIFVTFPFILVFSAALCASNISLIRHEGKRIVNLLRNADHLLLGPLYVGKRCRSNENGDSFTAVFDGLLILRVHADRSDHSQPYSGTSHTCV